MHIITRIERLRHREHHATVELIEAMLECKRTGAHLAPGYPSIFQFLTNHLKYSKAAASRRWKAMKCAERHPEVLEMLREHRTNLSVLATIEATLAKAADPAVLLSEIDGQSSAEVERRVAARNPVRPRREQIRREFERGHTGAGSAQTGGNLFGDNEEGIGAGREHEPRAGVESENPAGASAGREGNLDADVSSGADAEANTSADRDSDATDSGATGSGATDSGATGSGATDSGATSSGATDSDATGAGEDCAEPAARRERIRIAFSLDPAAYERLEEAMTILSRKIPAKLTLEATMQELLHFFLERKRPKPERPYKAPRGRHIPKALRDAVMIRDRGRCQFAGIGGRKCHSRHNLQIDHIQPVAKGGRTELENLRVLCANHNRHRVKVAVRNRFGRNAPVSNPRAGSRQASNSRARSQPGRGQVPGSQAKPRQSSGNQATRSPATRGPAARN